MQNGAAIKHWSHYIHSMYRPILYMDMKLHKWWRSSIFLSVQLPENITVQINITEGAFLYMWMSLAHIFHVPATWKFHQPFHWFDFHTERSTGSLPLCVSVCWWWEQLWTGRWTLFTLRFSPLCAYVCPYRDPYTALCRIGSSWEGQEFFPRLWGNRRNSVVEKHIIEHYSQSTIFSYFCMSERTLPNSVNLMCIDYMGVCVCVWHFTSAGLSEKQIAWGNNITTDRKTCFRCTPLYTVKKQIDLSL